MVHMCQRVISPGLFCIFFQILIFGVNSEVKGQNMAQNDKKFCLSHSVFQEAYIIRSWFLAHLTCKMMTSPDAFFIFSNFYFLSCEGGWGGGQKLAQNVSKFCLSHLVFHMIRYEPYLIWLWFCYTFVKYFQQLVFFFFIFFIFSKFWFFGFSTGGGGG